MIDKLLGFLTRRKLFAQKRATGNVDHPLMRSSLDGPYIASPDTLPPGCDPVRDRIEFFFTDGTTAVLTPNGTLYGEIPTFPTDEPVGACDATRPDRIGDDVSLDDAMHFHSVDGTSLLLFPDGTRIGEWPIDGTPLVGADDVR